jgi:PEGA domain
MNCKPLLQIFLSVSLVTLTGCAHLTDKGELTVNMTSIPTGATIVAPDGSQVGVTPVALSWRIPAQNGSYSVNLGQYTAVWPDGFSTSENVTLTGQFTPKPLMYSQDERSYVFRRPFSPQPRYSTPTQQQQQQQQQQTVIVPSTPQPSAPVLGTVIVSCDQADADIYIDGIFVGNTPSTLKLSDGIHIIEVRKEGLPSFKREIRVFSSSETTIRATLR